MGLSMTDSRQDVGVHVPQLSQDIFKGIPFASAPRYQLAQSLNETWKGARVAVEPGLTCPGFGTNNDFGWAIGEDCLNLNVVRPLGITANSKLPVLVWICGGGFQQGSNRDPNFNTSYILQTSVEIGHPVIVVSINYRLSGFGFLSGVEVQAQGVSNLGLRDQWKALEWISENIEDFGGDPNQVTIWGESAGAMSSAFLTTAYGGNNHGLFHRAIMTSGTAFGVPYLGSIASQTVYNTLTNATGCYYAIDSLQCLRDLPFAILNATLAAVPSPLAFLVSLDGDIIRNSPSYAIAHSPPLVAPIDIITGCNAEEGISPALLGQSSYNSKAEISAFLQYVLDLDASSADEYLSLYPENKQYPPYGEPMSLDWPALTATVGVQSGKLTRMFYEIMGDLFMMSGRRLLASSWSAMLPQNKAYSYRWDVYPTSMPFFHNAVVNGLGFSQHAADVSYQFRLPHIRGPDLPPLPNTTAMQRVSYAMQSQWVSFAATGDPNAHSLAWIPDWPAYTIDNAQNFVYNVTLHDTLHLRVERDDFRTKQLAWINARLTFLNKGLKLLAL
ncbi:MAG: hypothetical protein M1818_000957 [Claussenomyces sp. TS43310]|nr:MAG: hypothetical protein M1818_000957 [Claussenomyces sp. TS43310]